MTDSAPRITARDSGMVVAGNALISGQFAAGRDNNITVRQPAPQARFALPRDLTDFTGRHAELAWIEEVITAARVIVIFDGPGVGKSALANHAAHRLRDRYPAAQLYVRLGGARQPAVSPDEALRGLLAQLGIGPAAMPAEFTDRVVLYRSLMSSGLVLLDNAISAGQVEPLLPASPDCVTLITSRDPLAELEGASPLDLGRLPEPEALALLTVLLGDDRVGAEPEAARRIVTLCDALPLALRIAASLLRRPSRREQPLAGFAASLADERGRLDLLDAGNRAVRASFDLSYAGLSPAAARAFRLLGLLNVPALPPGLAAAVLGPDLAASGPATGVLGELTDAHLLEPAPAGWSRFHDLVRLFAGERAEVEEPAPERWAAVDRAYRWALAADPGGDEDQPVLTALVRQAAGAGSHENAGGASESGGPGYHDDGVAWRLADRLAATFDARGDRQDWLTLCETAVGAATRLADPVALATSLHHLSWVLRLLRRTGEAVRTADEALGQARLAGDERLKALILTHLGTLYRELHRYPDALAVLGEAAAACRELGDVHGEGLVRQGLGHVLLRCRDLLAAAEELERAAWLLRQAGDRVNEGWAHSNLITVRDELSHEVPALGHYRQARELFEAAGHRQGAAWADNHAGRVHRRYNRIEQAIEYHERALAVFKEDDDQYGTGWALTDLGIARRDAGLIRAGREVLDGIGDRDGAGWALIALAELEADLEAARAAAGLFEVTGSRHGQGAALLVMADLARTAGDAVMARDRYQRSLAALAGMADDIRERRARTGLAEVS